MTRTIFAAFLMLAAPAFAQDTTAEDLMAATPDVTMREARTVQADDHIIGSADAPHSMVAYLSVTCGHCATWFNDEWPTLKTELVDSGQLRVAIREVPTPPAQVAVAGFMIANCAGEDAWLDALTHQFAQQDATKAAFAKGAGRESMIALSETAGVGGEAELQACLASDEHYAPIDNSLARFDALGLNGVPAFYLDGTKVGGAHDAADIIALVSE